MPRATNAIDSLSIYASPDDETDDLDSLFGGDEDEGEQSGGYGEEEDAPFDYEEMAPNLVRRRRA